jgi:hypothetical protein
MKLEVGQVWTNYFTSTYTITRIDNAMVYYTNKSLFGLSRQVYLDTFMRTINEENGYFLLTDLTKALI